MESNGKNFLKKLLFWVFLVIIIIAVVIVILKYQVEGEKQMPYSIEKISITSRVEATSNAEIVDKWSIDLKENNDILIYFKKNDQETERTIKEIKLDNFKINQKPTVGNVVVYRPTGNTGMELYKESKTNLLEKSITYLGASVDTPKALEIRNEGGMMCFRVSLEDIGNFELEYNDGETISYDGSLLERIGVKNEDMNFKFSFDINITLDNNVTYQGNITLDLPSGDIIKDKECEKVYTEKDLENIIFKRV